MIEISNQLISATINPGGAELNSLVRRDTGLNYLWKGDPAWWGKYSPVLFPIVGTLKDNRFLYNGKQYELPRHGFAREKLFTAEKLSESTVLFILEDDPSTLTVYPFPFKLQLLYSLENDLLRLAYTVENTGTSPMYFSLGAHPAFAVPLVPDTAYTDYFLQFSSKETTGRYGLKDGLLLDESELLLNNEDTIPLTHELFRNDALVLKNLRSDSVSILSNDTNHGINFSIKGWPHLGIWAAAKEAPFVCIEPWQGHADPLSHDGRIVNKPGIVALAPGESWEKDWSVVLF